MINNLSMPHTTQWQIEGAARDIHGPIARALTCCVCVSCSVSLSVKQSELIESICLGYCEN